MLLRVAFTGSSAIDCFIRNNDLLRAAALTYTVTLAIVPILAIGFSVLRGFGLEDHLRSLIENYLALGSSRVTVEFMRYIKNTNAAAIGSVGGAFLLLSAISAMSTIERAFNTIFGVPFSRSYLRKFIDYSGVLFTVPVFMAAALAITTFFSITIGTKPAFDRVSPYLFAWAGFFFLFTFFPYTNVRWRPALAGSLLTAILFQIVQASYVYFQVGAARYRAIYGAVAAIPIFLVWTYVAWAIVLFGAEVTAAAQRGISVLPADSDAPDIARVAALYVMKRLAQCHLSFTRPVTYEELALESAIDVGHLARVLDRLSQAGLIVADARDGKAYRRRLLLGRAPAAIGLEEILACAAPVEYEAIADPKIRQVLEQLLAAEREAMKPLTLADLVNDGQQAKAPHPAAN